jgi:hypothetical protein
MASDLLVQMLMGQAGQMGQRQDPRRALAARLMQGQPPVAPIYNTGAGIAHALTQGLNSFVGARMMRDAEAGDIARQEALFQRAQDAIAQRRQADAAALAGVQPGAAPAPTPMPNDAGGDTMPRPGSVSVAPLPPPAAPAGDPRALNADAAARRQAIMDDPTLTPEQQAAALAAISGDRAAAGGVPPRPGGYRPNPGVDGAYAGLPAPSGAVPAIPLAAGARPAPAAPAPSTAPAAAPRPVVTPEEVQRVADLAGQGNAAAAARLPILREQLAAQERERGRGEDRAWRERQAEEQRAFQERQAQEARAAREAAAAEARVAREEAARLARESRPIPPHIQRAEDEDLQAIGAATGINERLRTFATMIDNEVNNRGTPSQRLALGPAQNVVSAGRNLTGLSSPNSVNYASFRSELERMRNESLRLNAGVQTDGDAQRAWNELITNINDPAVVSQRLNEIQMLNERAVALREALIASRRSGSNLPALDMAPFRTLTPDAAQAGPTGRRPELPAVGAIVDGYRYRGGNPADRNSWERAQ